MEQVTNIDVLDFIRLLVDFGNIYHLEDSDMTILRNNGEKCCDIDDDGQTKPIQIAFPQRAIDDAYCLFNPLKMTIADAQVGDKKGKLSTFARFYSEREMTLSVIVKKLIVKIVEVGYTKEVDSYEGLDILTAVSESCDKTMVEELNKINPIDYLSIFYMHKTKTANAQTSIFTEYLENKHKTFRKKTWTTLRTLFKTLFKLEKDDLEPYTYRATILSLPNVDAKLHVMSQIIDVVNPLCKILLKMDLMPEEWKKHLSHLDNYVHMWAWLTAKASSMDKKVNIISNGNDMPTQAWNTTATMPSSTPPEVTRIAINTDPSMPSGMPVASPSFPSMPSAGVYGNQMPTGGGPVMPPAMPMGGGSVMPSSMPTCSGMAVAALGGMPSVYPSMGIPVAAPPAPQGCYIPIC